MECVATTSGWGACLRLSPLRESTRPEQQRMRWWAVAWRDNQWRGASERGVHACQVRAIWANGHHCAVRQSGGFSRERLRQSCHGPACQAHQSRRGCWAAARMPPARFRRQSRPTEMPCPSSTARSLRPPPAVAQLTPRITVAVGQPDPWALAAPAATPRVGAQGVAGGSVPTDSPVAAETASREREHLCAAPAWPCQRPARVRVERGGEAAPSRRFERAVWSVN